MAMRDVPPELLPLFNAALKLMYPLSKEIDYTRPMPATTYGTFALNVLDLLPLSQPEREAKCREAQEAVFAAMHAKAAQAEADTAYQLTGVKKARADATADLLASLGDFKL